MGGSHTLNYSLRNPQGAVCLSTNLAIEAIVAKLATNVYYAAYGTTNEIDVALSPASHDPAGYTLRLNGALCATGQPPWQVAVSNLTAGAHTLTVQSKTFPDLADEAALYVIKVSLVPNYNRDGVIDAYDQARATTGEVFRIWINDDRDVGDTAQDGGSDIPGQTASPDHANYVVNGRRDLADFFPILVDLGLHEQAFGRPDYCRIRQADGAVNFICTALGNLNAGWYLTRDIASCGAGLDASMLEATVIPVPSGGFALPDAFTQWLGLTGGRGVILVEGAAASSESLVLEAVVGGQIIATTTLPMRVVPVEEMYIRVNLRDDPPVVTTGSARPPGNNKDVVFLHGFNVNQGDARGWHAETFKRLWHSGFNSRFHAVTWRGDIGIVNAFHFYSDGDEVFELRATTPDIFSGALASLGRYAWHKQETLKGRGTATLVGTSWAGWGFEHPTYMTNINGVIYTFEHYPTAAAVNAAPATKLRDIPVFRYNPTAMFTNTIPAATRDEILAKGIPALSPAAGMTAVFDKYHAFDMDTAFKPAGGAWGRDQLLD